MKQNIKCLEFTSDNLEKYVDSMLFDSGTNIAYGEFSSGEKNLQIFLDVRGEVRVTYKDEVYRSPSEFPEELIELIRENPNHWDLCDGVYVGLNNWFEYIYDDDGDVFEDDLSKCTPERIKEDMTKIAEQYFGGEKNE